MSLKTTWQKHWFVVVMLLSASIANNLAVIAATAPESAYNPPDCVDDACIIWKNFRKNHPFPHQTLAIAPSNKGSLVLIISEPSISKTELEKNVRTQFGEDLMKYTTRRWMIGADGWLEDVIVEFKSPPQDTLSDPTTIKRIEALQTLLFGATFGAVIEPANVQYRDIAYSVAPNDTPTPAELRKWISDTSWTVIYESSTSLTPSSLKLDSILTNPTVPQTYISANNQLVILVLPRTLLDAAQTSNEDMEALLRVPFRVFATTTDAILGGVWGEKGLTFIGRSRRTLAAAIPPLRFETFALLAREQSSELQQSYERDNLFAGRLTSGEYAEKDWAPILLSDSLINTEFGALLNITDQLLKGWSEAGRVNYLYFDYPLRPTEGQFVFGNEKLSTKVWKEISKNSSVLFNWNTAGSAVVVHDEQGLNLLAASRAGALPVTYGSDVNQGNGMQTGNDLHQLRKWEDTAYDYFNAQQDPNLARVVSYTLIYQIFHAVRTEQKSNTLSNTAPTIPLQSKGYEVLVNKAEELLTEDNNSIEDQLNFYHIFFDDDNKQLAILLADPRRVQFELLANTSEFKRLLRSSEAKFNEWITTSNIDLSSIGTEEKLLALFPEDLKGELERLGELKSAIEQLKLKIRLSTIIRAQISPIQDIDKVLIDYADANKTEPTGSIKTPSFVISWGIDNDGVGGHNLTARTLRIEIDKNIKKPVLERFPGENTVLRVPSSQADLVLGNAGPIARKVEHGKADITSDDLAKLTLSNLRTEDQVLGQAKIQFDVFRYVSDGKAQVAFNFNFNLHARNLHARLENILKQNITIRAAIARGDDGNFIALYRDLPGDQSFKGKRFLDTQSMHEFIAVRPLDKVVIVNENEISVKYIVASIKINSSSDGNGNGTNISKDSGSLGSNNILLLIDSKDKNAPVDIIIQAVDEPRNFNNAKLTSTPTNGGQQISINIQLENDLTQSDVTATAPINQHSTVTDAVTAAARGEKSFLQFFEEVRNVLKGNVNIKNLFMEIMKNGKFKCRLVETETRLNLPSICSNVPVSN